MTNAKDSEQKQRSTLNITTADGQAIPEPQVPVFRCVVYIRTLESGKIHACVANLPELEVTADSERSALQRIVPEFKKRVTEFKQQGKTIPWIEPPTAIASDQDKRVVPVHL